MASIESRISLIKSESKRLSNYVSGLSEIDLSMPSACEGWSVGDVVAHLIWEAEFTLDIIPRGLRGDVSPMEGFPDPGAKDAQWMDSFFAQSAITRKKELGQSLLLMFREKHEQLVEMLSGLSYEDWKIPCYHPNDVRPADDSIMRHINELAIHEWDIRSELESTPHLSADVVPDLMERIEGLFNTPKPADFLELSGALNDGRYRFELVGQMSNSKDLVIENSMCLVEDVSQSSAKTVCRCCTDDFILLMNRRITLDSLTAQ